jgi:hypothetical protein
MTMRVLRTIVLMSLIVSMGTSAVAGDLRSASTQPVEQPSPAENKPIPKPYLWTGTAMFVGGMAVGLYAFINNKNGDFPGQDEYYATNRKLGAAGLLTAFGGGALLFLGKHRASRSPMVTVNRDRVTVSKHVSW